MIYDNLYDSNYVADAKHEKLQTTVSSISYYWNVYFLFSDCWTVLTLRDFTSPEKHLPIIDCT